MTITYPMPRLIENNNDLDSLVKGDQVELDIFIGEHGGLRELPNRMRKWAIYEGRIRNKYAFITGHPIDGRVILSFRVNKKDMLVDGAVYLNMHKTEFFTYDIPRSKYSQKLKRQYNQKLNMLKEAGL